MKKLLCGVVVWMAGSCGWAAAESKVMTWKVDGVERQAIVYLPTAKATSGKAPLVFAFHGHGDDARNYQGV